MGYTHYKTIQASRRAPVHGCERVAITTSSLPDQRVVAVYRELQRTWKKMAARTSFFSIFENDVLFFKK